MDQVLEERINQMSTELAKIHIRTNPPYYSQIPQELTRDPKITPGAKLTYATMHGFAPEKYLNKIVEVEVGIETIAEFIGRTEKQIRRYILELKKAGWILPIRQGKQKANKYLLFPVKKRTFEAIRAMKRVHMKINFDYELYSNLTRTLYK